MGSQGGTELAFPPHITELAHLICFSLPKTIYAGRQPLGAEQALRPSTTRNSGDPVTQARYKGKARTKH